MNNENQFDMEEFGRKSEEYYNQIKSILENKSKGKYVALDFETKNYWLGETATEALTKARESSPPQKLFYLIQVGSPAPFNIQSITIRQHPKYDFARSH